MHDSNKAFESLSEKVKHLILVNQALMSENKALQDAVITLKNERKELYEQISALNMSKTQPTEMEMHSFAELEAEAMKQKLEVLIEETEWCINELKSTV